jgi:hypothetical protein
MVFLILEVIGKAIILLVEVKIIKILLRLVKIPLSDLPNLTSNSAHGIIIALI